MFEFRLANHSAILFNGEVPVALSGNLLKAQQRVNFADYRARAERPYTAVEPYSGQDRLCRFLVVPLQGKAKGATLVVFRWIGPTMRGLAQFDRALAGLILLGFLGTAAILWIAVQRAIQPVEEVTRLAEEAEATDLSRRVSTSSGGEEFRRLAGVINSLFERLERAFRAHRRLVSDAAHELKTPTAVLLGEARDALRPEATEGERRRSLETIADVSKGHRARGRRAARARARRRGASTAHGGARPLRARRGGDRRRGRARREARSGVRALARGRDAGPRRSAGTAAARVESRLERRPLYRAGVDGRAAGPRRSGRGHAGGGGPRPRRRPRRPRPHLRAVRAARRGKTELSAGSGLGLAIAEQAAQTHGARSRWRRGREEGRCSG